MLAKKLAAVLAATVFLVSGCAAAIKNPADGTYELTGVKFALLSVDISSLPDFGFTAGVSVTIKDSKMTLNYNRSLSIGDVKLNKQSSVEIDGIEAVFTLDEETDTVTMEWKGLTLTFKRTADVNP